MDLIGYRKFGHNELDQPSFTNPLMYKQVAKMTPVARLYEKFLIDNEIMKADDIEKKKLEIREDMEVAYKLSKQLSYE